ncbi:MAG: SAM-dependent methyltransferase [Streptosporangiales bacterium]|nr:SAM-dependent methyltransferase [Streptosporangiales bacterium]
MAGRPPETRTALGPMTIAAAEQYTPAERRIVHDDLAARFIPAGLRAAIRVPAVRRLLVAATERQATGIWGSMLCRKRYADDRVAEAVREGPEQLLVLGAGLDTRAYRLAGDLPVVEVDLPANIADKRARVEAVFGRVPPNVTLLPVDFETDDLAALLDLDRPTMIVWEAVTQYLTENGFRKTFALLSKAAPGGRLIFTYVLADFLDGSHSYGAERAYHEYVIKHRIWRFGLLPGEVAPLLREYGWTETEQVGPEEYRARYLANRPGLAVSEAERFVHAVKEA